MALRKMLGDMEWEECKDIMQLMDTQSKTTIIKWALTYASEHYLPLLEAYEDTISLRQLMELTGQYRQGMCSLKEVKEELKEARKQCGSISHPIACAAGKAVVSACASVSTLTNAFGALLYGCAAKAYDVAGLQASDACYEQLAKEELRQAYDALAACCIHDEKHPAKIRWHC